METLRLFIAIELDPALRAALKRAQTQLQDACARGAARATVRWVALPNLHLTLKFLGNAQSSRVPALQQALARVATKNAPFTLRARGLGCFPNIQRPNNVWVGLDGELQRAALLVQQIDDACAALGFACNQRGFAPHLTLGRVQRAASPAQRAALGELVANSASEIYGDIHACSAQWIASVLRPNGPTYTILSEHFFSKAPLP